MTIGAAGSGATRSRSSVGPRPTDLRLAAVHLRTGLLILARAEFETMAGEGTLDDDALLDLAEVRWRTGDLAGAGDAAAAYLASGRGTALAYVILAEAQAALGRPVEARRLAGHALERMRGSLDALFAGLPRASFWPPEGVPALTADTSRPAALSASAAGEPARAAPPETRRAPDARGSSGGVAELEAARGSLAAGDHAAAAVHLALVLRLSPALAPAVLDAAGSIPGPSFDIVRGDAYRLVGREVEALRSFAAAGSALAATGDPAGPAPRSPADGATPAS